MKRYEPSFYFDHIEKYFPFPKLWEKVDHVWDILKKKDYILDGMKVGHGIHIKRGSEIERNVYVGDNVTIGPGAYVREGTIICDDVKIGRAEIKGSILLEGAQIPHNSYVGDSIIGRKANIGAGTVISNYKNDGSNIFVDDIDTKLKKFGAIVGDNCRIGCNSVLCPGTLIGPCTHVYPLSLLRGFYGGYKLIKNLPSRLEIIRREM